MIMNDYSVAIRALRKGWFITLGEIWAVDSRLTDGGAGT
jgi:hypothetical protein